MIINKNIFNIGDDFPKLFNSVIEIPVNSMIKYEIGEYIKVDRFLSTSMFYPGNYGFIPNTLAKDKDPLDVLVICNEQLFVGCIISCRAIGILEMEDGGQIDRKIIALPSHKISKNYDHISDIYDISDYTRKKIQHFFAHYKDNEENANVQIGDFEGKAIADSEIESCYNAYNLHKEVY